MRERQQHLCSRSSVAYIQPPLPIYFLHFYWGRGNCTQASQPLVLSNTGGPWNAWQSSVTYFCCKPFLKETHLRRNSFSGRNARLQNSPFFCVLKYARAVKQKVWNEAKNRERDWGEKALALRARNTLTPRFTDFLTDFEKKKRYADMPKRTHPRRPRGGQSGREKRPDKR